MCLSGFSAIFFQLQISSSNSKKILQTWMPLPPFNPIPVGVGGGWILPPPLYFFLMGSKYVSLILFLLFAYILWTLCHLKKKFETPVHWVRYRLAAFKKCVFCKSFLLDPQINTLFYFLILMTGSSSNFELKMMMCHDKLKNVNHGVLRDALVEVSGTPILFNWIGLKILIKKLL